MGADCLRCFLLEVSGEVLSYCPLRDGTEINKVRGYCWYLKHIGPGSVPSVTLKSIENVTASPKSQGVIGLALENP